MKSEAVYVKKKKGDCVILFDREWMKHLKKGQASSK